ncbi:MAG TPA: hypothetical protein VEX18_08840 [Polyangiaceae bacterium]|nr:hypothetical protein [Polyangiaceae bacterium]
MSAFPERSPSPAAIARPGSGEIKQLFGVYRDELRKSDGRWRFASRRFELRRELTVAQ